MVRQDLTGIPIFPAGINKAPLTAHGFKDATTDPAQIAAWWERWPEALTGVPTGDASGLFVVDVDPEGMHWYQQHREALTGSRVHVTRRGLHLVYRMPRHDIGCSAKGLPAGVDVRGTGGYVIWWPAHGGRVVGGVPGPAPKWLLDRLTAPGKAKTKAPKTANPRRRPAEPDIGIRPCW